MSPERKTAAGDSAAALIWCEQGKPCAHYLREQGKPCPRFPLRE